MGVRLFKCSDYNQKAVFVLSHSNLAIVIAGHRIWYETSGSSTIIIYRDLKFHLKPLGQHFVKLSAILLNICVCVRVCLCSFYYILQLHELISFYIVFVKCYLHNL